MERYRVVPGRRIRLKDWDPEDTSEFAGGKSKGKAKLEELNKRLGETQELLYAQHKHGLLIVLQGMDASGKDGTIRSVFRGVNPQGVNVTSFKVPTAEERDHDFLWRIHRCTPAKGKVAIFNRSHYEDVVAVRVRRLAEPTVWRRRYALINAFERLLTDEGTTIIKYFLHVSFEEQGKRLQARLDEPHKRWKFNRADLAERKLWPAYMAAYEDALSKTSTEKAPWYIVPADCKWYRDLIVASVILDTLKKLKMRYPRTPVDN